MPSLGTAMMLTVMALERENPDCAVCRDSGWDTRGWRVRKCSCPAQGIEARQGQDPKGLDRNDESPVTK